MGNCYAVNLGVMLPVCFCQALTAFFIIYRNNLLNNKSIEITLLALLIVLADLAYSINAVILVILKKQNGDKDPQLTMPADVTLFLTFTLTLLAFWVFTAKFWVLSHRIQRIIEQASRSQKESDQRWYQAVYICGIVITISAFVVDLLLGQGNLKTKTVLWSINCLLQILTCIVLLDSMRRLSNYASKSKSQLNNKTIIFMAVSTIVLMGILLFTAFKPHFSGADLTRLILAAVEFLLLSSCLLSTLFYLIIQLESVAQTPAKPEYDSSAASTNKGSIISDGLQI